MADAVEKRAACTTVKSCKIALPAYAYRTCEGGVCRTRECFLVSMLRSSSLKSFGTQAA